MTKPKFSEREKEVVEHLLKGKGNKQIAQNMGVSVRTVEFHLSNIYTRLDVHSRAEAIIKLTQESPERPTSKNTSSVLRKSTVAKKDQRAENERNKTQRRFPMKEILISLVVLVSSVFNIHIDNSVVTGTTTPSPIAYEIEETLPPTPTPLGVENTPPPTPTPLGMENILPSTPTPLGVEDTPPPTPSQSDVIQIIMCTPPPCPGNNFACGNPNGCSGGCGMICLPPTPLRMEETATPLPLLPVEGGETSTPLP